MPVHYRSKVGYMFVPGKIYPTSSSTLFSTLFLSKNSPNFDKINNPKPASTLFSVYPTFDLWCSTQHSIVKTRVSGKRSWEVSLSPFFSDWCSPGAKLTATSLPATAFPSRRYSNRWTEIKKERGTIRSQFCDLQGISIRPFPGCENACRRVEAEEVSNSMNKIHQTWERPYSKAL